MKKESMRRVEFGMLLVFVIFIYLVGTIGFVSASGIGGGLGIQLEVVPSDGTDDGAGNDSSNAPDNVPVNEDEDDDNDDEDDDNDDEDKEDLFIEEFVGEGSSILGKETLKIYESSVSQTKIILNSGIVEEEIDPRIILGFAIVDIIALIFFITVMVRFLKTDEKRN